MTDFSNRPKPPTAAALRESFDRALTDLDRLMALPAGHPDVLRANGMRERVPVPAQVLAELDLVTRSRCYACGHRLAYAATCCPQCEEGFDGREPPSAFPEDCRCTRCQRARREEAQ